jgi:predicted nuclease of restriction endonuclease-like (RecB) superfamily
MQSKKKKEKVADEKYFQASLEDRWSTKNLMNNKESTFCVRGA